MKWSRRQVGKYVASHASYTIPLRFEKLESRYCMDAGLIHFDSEEPLDLERPSVASVVASQLAESIEESTVSCETSAADLVPQGFETEDVEPWLVENAEKPTENQTDRVCRATDLASVERTQFGPTQSDSLTTGDIDLNTDQTESLSNENLPLTSESSESLPAVTNADRDSNSEKPTHLAPIVNNISWGIPSTGPMTPSTNSVESLRLPGIAITLPNTAALQDLHAYFAAQYDVDETSSREAKADSVESVAHETSTMDTHASPASAVVESNFLAHAHHAVDLDPTVENTPLLMPIVASAYIADSAPALLQIASQSILVHANAITVDPLPIPPVALPEKIERQQDTIAESNSIPTTNPLVLLAVAGLLGIPELVKRRMRSKHLVFLRNASTVTNERDSFSIR